MTDPEADYKNTSSPWLRVNFCSKDDGIRVGTYQVTRKVVNALHDALTDLSELSGRFGEKEVYIQLSGGMRLKLITNWEVGFSKLPDVKHWAQHVWVLGTHFRIPLPYITKSDHFWKSLVEPIDIPVEGTQHLYYWDEDLQDWIVGTDWDPVKYYRVLGDGLPNAPYVALALLIIKILVTLGLVRLVIHFVAKLFGFIRRAMFRDTVRDHLTEILQQVQEKQEVSNVDLMGIQDSLDRLYDVIGLRLTL